MSETMYKFRTSVGGFHRGDVAGYIEKMASQHRTEVLDYENKILALQEENRALNQQINLLMMATPITADLFTAVPAAPAAEPVEELIEETLDEAVAAPVEEIVEAAAEEVIEEAAAEVAEEAVEEVAEEVAEEISAAVLEQKKEELLQKELSAYRRAAALEHNATQRVKKMYEQMGTMCDDTMDGFSAVDATTKETIDLIIAQAKMLEQTYTTLFGALRASQDKLATMNDQLNTDTDE